jgi:UDP-N-acetylglucosamine 3-dehydrogenase
MKSKMLKGCLIGAGYIGKTHAEAYQKISGVQLTAVADNNQEKAAELAAIHGGKGYGDYGKMIEAERPDFVDVCLPSRLHREGVITALTAGCHVIVEKPFAVDLEAIDAMLAAAERSGNRLMVAHVCRFMPQYVYAHRVISEKSLGNPLFYNCWRNSETPNWSWDGWLLNKSLSGGTIMDLSIHDIDIANWFFGIPEGYRACESFRLGKVGPSHVMSFLSYPNGARASIEGGHLMPKGYPFTMGYRLLFDGGIIEWNSRETGPSFLQVFTDDREERINLSGLPSLTPKGANGLADPYAEELAHFATCLVSGEPFRIATGEARLAVETVLKLMTKIIA